MSYDVSAAVNNAIIPVRNTQKDFYNWAERHAEKTRLASTGSHDLIFVGDSITHMFELEGRGLPVWQQLFGTYRTLNLGYGWDCTQNVLWRLQNGEFENQRPRLLVLNIGTNNLTGNSGGRANLAAEIVEGICAIADEVRRQSPDTVILHMGLFPRGLKADAIYGKVKEVNALLQAAIAGRSQSHYLDIGTQLTQPDGEISLDIMNDRVHPTSAGYRIWGGAIGPVVRKYLEA